MTKRILYIESNRDGTVGGSYYSLLHLLEVLDKKKYEPHIIFCQGNFLIGEFKRITPYVSVKELALSYSAPIHTVSELIKYPYKFTRRILLKQKELIKVLDEVKPDIVHLNNSYAVATEMILACRLKGILTIAHDRGTEYPCSMQAKIFGRWLDAIICVSDHYKDNVVKQKIHARRIVRIYDGIKIKCANDESGQVISDVRKENGISPDEPLLGIVGNIMRWKGQAIVLEAVRIIKKIMPEIKCLIIGEVADRSKGYFGELNEYIEKNNLGENIFILGYRRDALEIIRQLDILLHASIEPEPFGLVILEGMSEKKPVIASNAGGPTEIVINGETGILIEPGNSGQMAEAILYILSNKTIANEMGRKGQLRFLKYFTREIMGMQTEQLYDEILLLRQ